jgi:adenylate cyclase class IV
MREGQALREGEEIASDLIKKLGIPDKDLVTGAYMDLLLKSS